MLLGLFYHHQAEMVECSRLDVNRTRRRVVMPFLALQKNNRNPIASTQRRSIANEQRLLQLATISNMGYLSSFTSLIEMLRTENQ